MHKSVEEILTFVEKKSLRDENLVRFAYKLEQVELEQILEEFLKEEHLFFFSKPSQNTTFLGIGKLDDLASKKLLEAINSSDLQFQIIEANYSRDSLPELPLIVGAEKFLPDSKEKLWSDFSNSDWHIPQILITKTENAAYLIFQFFGKKPNLEIFEELLSKFNNHDTEKNFSSADYDILETTEIDEWTKIVSRAIAEISKQSLEKVVLARRVQYKLKSCFKISKALSNLQDKYPDCSTFAFKRSNSIFFGSTPETLFSLNGKVIETEALAGSAGRGINSDEDIIQELKLLNNQKDINEHNNVLSFVLAKLELVCEKISYEKKPQIKKLANIQHLQTPIKAELKAGINILDLQRLLHPTPAVCGLPQKKALELIQDLEYFDRGLYAGVLGWFSEHQKAEFVVGIRSAILKENIVTAYAGCGIVQGSDPVLEFQETELKFKPILSLLKNESTN